MCRLRRSSKTTQRWCSRRLPSYSGLEPRGRGELPPVAHRLTRDVAGAMVPGERVGDDACPFTAGYAGPSSTSARGARHGERPREGEEHAERRGGMPSRARARSPDEALALVAVEHAEHRAQASARTHSSTGCGPSGLPASTCWYVVCHTSTSGVRSSRRAAYVSGRATARARSRPGRRSAARGWRAATSRMSRCEGASKFEGTCIANVPPGREALDPRRDEAQVARAPTGAWRS